MTKPLLTVRGLVKHFPIAGGLFGPKKVVRAVDDIAFDITADRAGRTRWERACSVPHPATRQRR